VFSMALTFFEARQFQTSLHLLEICSRDKNEKVDELGKTQKSKVEQLLKACNKYLENDTRESSEDEVFDFSFLPEDWNASTFGSRVQPQINELRVE
jgi:hypothetical protein